MTRSLLLATVALVLATPALAASIGDSSETTAINAPTDTKVYAPTDNRVNAPSSVRKNTTTTVGPTTTKVGPSATNGPNNNTNNNSSSANAGASTSHGGTIVFNPTINPNITVIVPNSNTTSSSAESYTGGVAPPPAPAPLLPAPRPCALGVVANLGLDVYGRPTALNLRQGPGTQFNNVMGPDLGALILFDGTRLQICARNGRWLNVEISTTFGRARGWVSDRYILSL